MVVLRSANPQVAPQQSLKWTLERFAKYKKFELKQNF